MVLSVQTWLLRAETKTMHPYEWGILGVKARALGWLSDERFPRDHRHQPAASLAAQDSGRAKALGIRRFRPNCTNWLVSCPATLLRNQGCRVHQLARSWLQEWLARAQFYPCPNCPIKLSCQGFQSERERNFCLPTIPIAVLQKPLICKKCSNPTLVRTFDMACYATGVLIRRIQEVSEYKKSIKKQRNLI
jgi:hypothetical protein